MYIRSAACISPQESFGQGELFELALHRDTNSMTCVEPDYSKYINPVQIRRMSRALKMGFSAAMECLKQEPERIPEAIIIGTGKGCMSDTEIFLHSIREYQETALNATYFIHSTYNQLNGMIALNKKINSYNVTYVHRGFSFEHALLDAALHFAEGDAKNILVGSFDEMTREHFTVKKHWGYWKQEKVQSDLLLLSETPGTIAGEGTSFYLLSDTPPDDKPCAAIRHVSTLYKPDQQDMQIALEALLRENDLKPEDIDLLMLGENGDTDRPGHYAWMKQTLASATPLYFKHLCGEYDTATNFACWLSRCILEQQRIPEYAYHPADDRRHGNQKIKRLLIYNNYFDLNQSLVLMNV